MIRALNEDMPFNQFAQWQIAGDELAPDNWQAWLPPAFFCRGLSNANYQREFETTRYNQLDDMVLTVGNAMLGLTVGFAAATTTSSIQFRARITTG